MWTTTHITSGMSAGRYEGALRDIIHAFKYEGRRTLADQLGAWMRDSGEPILRDCDFIIPVPLHPWRRMQRGFNQARDLATRLDRPVVDALRRVRPTKSQMLLDAAARRTNVRAAFAPSLISGAGLSRVCGAGLCGPRFQNRIVVLVDDVRTTGTTLDECAGVLGAAGAREVRALTLAFAETHSSIAGEVPHAQVDR
jgi:ComF family protein